MTACRSLGIGVDAKLILYRSFSIQWTVTLPLMRSLQIET